jgi:phospholipid/cholesterol/gamma-HCH transport system substrate-binding protein
MTREDRRIVSRFLIVFVLVGALGLAASLYTLLHERLALPFGDYYELTARFSAADGVISGVGQPVDVVGVNVGEVTSVRLADGTAVVKLRIDRHMVPRVFANATATIEPITPLEDLQIDLDPGGPPARPLARAAVLSLAQTAAAPQLSDLLATLDADTRSYLQSLIASLDQAVGGRGLDLRRALAVLGPTSAQVHDIAASLAARRTTIARLVHNLALIARAASVDHQVGTVIAAGDETLRAVAAQDGALRLGLQKLPRALRLAGSTLVELQPFAGQLAPALQSLAPAVRQLPQTLAALNAFARTGSATLGREIRPLVSAATPLVQRLAPLVPALSTATPDLSGSFQALEYLVNELAYHPPGTGEGLLFWLAWFFHNGNSVASTADANGGIGRALPLVSCAALAGGGPVAVSLGLDRLCPR